MKDQPQVFISYSRENRVQANKIAEGLRQDGWNVYIDEAMPNATRFADQLIGGLRLASCVLVLWSKHASESDWVICEASLALARNKLVHAKLDDSEPPSIFSEYQAANLSKWNGDSEYPEWRRILTKVASLVYGGAPASVSLTAPKSFENITHAHIALTSSSWFRTKPPHDPNYPWQIHLMLVGDIEALDRVENVVYLFDRSYGLNRPDKVHPIYQEYALTSSKRDDNFGVYELANGYSVVAAKVKIRDQTQILELSRLVDIVDRGPMLKDLYASTNRLWSKG